MPKPGAVFETATNAYTGKDIIGNGGAGTVFLVSDAEGQEFALKCLRTTDSRKRQRFAKELSFCQQSHHKNIIRVLDHGVFKDGKEALPFYVMPLYHGALRALMQAGLKPEQILPLFDQILSGVEAAHLRGVYHRDLKPENVLCDHAGDRLVIGDFGIAHFEEEELLTAAETKNQERLANFIYAAPEQKVRAGTVDVRADIFALGLMLNEMFTGAVPSGVGYPLIANASPSHSYLDEIVTQMIAHSPADRYPTIARIKEELAARGNAFVALQKLDAVSRKVVPASSPDDPLGGQDVTIAKIDYEPGELIFWLEPPPPPAWTQAFLNLGDYIGYRGMAEPARVQFFHNGTASVGANENTASEIAGMFRMWVASVNKAYRTKLERDAEQKHRERLNALEADRLRADEKARVAQKLANLL